MGRPIDLVGQRFGRLTVLEKAANHITKSGEPKRRWLCMCDCGNRTYATTYDLRKGDTKSCGCYMLECRRKNASTHHGSNTRLYSIWLAMKGRCNNENNSDYKDYGGRGIGVCPEWANDFSTFRDWALSHEYKDNLSIDRIDVNGNYEPSNCRWITQKSQCNNKRNNISVTYNGETHNISEWSEILGIKYQTIYMRLKKGWDVERALTTPA